jgi:hypothetical protein
MNKLHAVLAAAAFGLSVPSFAQGGDADAARQKRMDEAYANSQHGTQVADSGIREDLHKAGHAVHEGVRATGHAVHQGVKATGHAIHQGVRATGHAIHKGVDAVTK